LALIIASMLKSWAPWKLDIATDSDILVRWKLERREGAWPSWLCSVHSGRCHIPFQWWTAGRDDSDEINARLMITASPCFLNDGIHHSINLGPQVSSLLSSSIYSTEFMLQIEDIQRRAYRQKSHRFIRLMVRYISPSSSNTILMIVECK
jgi:hypothetical protein